MRKYLDSLKHHPQLGHPKPKPLCTKEDLISLLTFNWSHASYKHERERVQMAFLLLVNSFTACRTSSLVVSRQVPDSGLRYKDCMLRLVRGDNDQERWQLDITFRHRKGKTGVSTTHTLWQHTPLILCPISLFLTLALADGVFSLVKNIGDLKKIKVPKGLRSLAINIDPSAAEVYCCQKTSFSPIIPGLETRHYRESLRRLSADAGFPIPVKPYAIRRGTANLIHSTGLFFSRRRSIPY